jgi:hypothetical protein
MNEIQRDRHYLHKRKVFFSSNKSLLTLRADILELGIGV